MHERAQHHVLQHGQAGERLHDLERASDAEARGAVWRHPGNVFALEENDAFVGMEKAADQIEDRGFAGAVGTDDEQYLARVHRERNVLHRPEPAKALGDVLHFENGRHWAAPPSSWLRFGVCRRLGALAEAVLQSADNAFRQEEHHHDNQNAIDQKMAFLKHVLERF